MNFKSIKIRGVIVLSFALIVTLAIIFTATSIHGIARAAGSPTITSDQTDYSPGSTVTLTGASWASGEAVHIYVNDSVGNTWSLISNPDPTAGTNGGFTYQFSLPNTFIANYAVTATGPTSGTATTTFTDAANPCPNNDPTSWQTDNQVGASFSPSGLTETYTFSSFVNESSSGGIPGLIEYCVYPSSVPHSVTVDPALKGANGSAWTASLGTSRFSFSRPGGDPTNISLNGATGITMGTATWSSSLPTSQTIVLHVNDPAECSALYGSGTLTCFVLPGSPPQQAKDLTVKKTATPSFTRTYTWGIDKSVDQNKQTIAAGGSAKFNYKVDVTHDAGTDSGWQVTGTITVSNPNGFDVSGVNVTDTIDNNGICNVNNGANVTVPANGSLQLSYTCTFTSNPGSGTNTANATWDSSTYNTPDGSAQGTANYDFSGVTPKVVDGSVSVTDTLEGTLGTVSYTDSSPKTFNYPYTFTNSPAGSCTDYPNTATFTTSDTSTTGSANQSVTVCVAEDLGVSKTASAGFTRDYNWKISKSVDKTLIEQIGGTATFNYTVSVMQTATKDTGWHVHGYIYLTNPNDFFDFTVLKVTDVVDDGGSCTVTGGTNVPVPAGTTVSLSYTCNYSSQPAYNVTANNTATATWDSTSSNTPDNSASGHASFTFNDGSYNNPKAAGNKLVTVTDTFNNITTTLGTVTATDTSPFASQTYKYSRTINVPKSNCVTYTNTATLVEAKKSSNRTVKLCGPANTGALTIGFWQSTNGQSIITGQANSGPCPSAAWLTQYNPFKDLSSTADCSTTATYVSNIITAANASGSSMNARLKAQMLATALDVYFSDPSLGGNMISAPAPLGGVKIDLHKICQMIDGPGGIATCSGTLQNVSSAFGGSQSLTVAQMLTYAASQSNSDGSTWYGNVKATQQQAKDAFDSINNQVAFAP